MIPTLLAGAWRSPAPALDLSTSDARAALSRAEPAMGRSGCAALVWRRLQATPHASLREAAPYRRAHRFQLARAAAQRASVTAVVSLLRERGVEPLLVKGWSTSRHYPELGLRPFGDTDLVVRPHEREVVSRVLLEHASASPQIALMEFTQIA